MNRISNIYSGIMLFLMRLKKPASISHMSGRALIRDILYMEVTDSGRYIFIVGINKGKGIFRTITARDMTEREKSLYKRR